LNLLYDLKEPDVSTPTDGTPAQTPTLHL